MFIKLAWRFVASGAVLLCIGCGSTEESKCCETSSAPVCTPTCATPPANEAAAATRDRLIRKPSLTGPEKLALGDALRDLGEYNSAETSYFGALSRGGLSPDESYRAQMGPVTTAARDGTPRIQPVQARVPAGPDVLSRSTWNGNATKTKLQASEPRNVTAISTGSDVDF